jgi:hypothetical protein
VSDYADENVFQTSPVCLHCPIDRLMQTLCYFDVNSYLSSHRTPIHAIHRSPFWRNSFEQFKQVKSITERDKRHPASAILVWNAREATLSYFPNRFPFIPSPTSLSYDGSNGSAFPPVYSGIRFISDNGVQGYKRVRVKIYHYLNVPLIKFFGCG